MVTIQININESIVDKVMFFLEHLPQNLIKIKYETSKSIETQTQRGVFREYANVNKQSLEAKAWENHLMDKSTITPMMNLQTSSMKTTWDNVEDEAWDEL